MLKQGRKIIAVLPYSEIFSGSSAAVQRQFSGSSAAVQRQYAILNHIGFAKEHHMILITYNGGKSLIRIVFSYIYDFSILQNDMIFVLRLRLNYWWQGGFDYIETGICLLTVMYRELPIKRILIPFRTAIEMRKILLKGNKTFR